MIISDTSCFIALEGIDKIVLLHELFPIVQTTQTVADEFGNALPVWVEIKTVRNKKQLYLLQQQIDAGEASAIALALETPDAVLIIDERRDGR